MSVVASGFFSCGTNAIEVPLNQAFNLSILYLPMSVHERSLPTAGFMLRRVSVA
jgi:hypothetical protein